MVEKLGPAVSTPLTKVSPPPVNAVTYSLPSASAEEASHGKVLVAVVEVAVNVFAVMLPVSVPPERGR